MSFPEVLDHIGGMGRFQVMHVAFLAIPLLMLASHNLLQNFTAGVPEHHCQVHININNTPYTNLTGKLAAKDLLRVSIPMDSNLQPEKCHRFVTMQWQLLDSNATVTNLTELETEPCADGWVYDKSIFTSTIITEWDLVCDSRQLKQMAQSIYMAGVLAGGIIFGSLSDRFGRRSPLIWCYLQMTVTGTSTAFSLSFTAYCIFRFLTGMAFSGIVMNGVSLSVEWTPTRTRAIVVTMYGYCITIGQCILPGVAYAIPNWRWLQLVVSLPYFICFIYTWWFAESARWLVIAGRPDEAVKQLQRVARINRKKEEGDKLNIEVLRSNMQKEIASAKSSHTFIDLVRTPVLRRISFCLCFRCNKGKVQPAGDAMEGWTLVQGKRGKRKARAPLLSSNVEIPQKTRKGATDTEFSALPMVKPPAMPEASITSGASGENPREVGGELPSIYEEIEALGLTPVTHGEDDPLPAGLHLSDLTPARPSSYSLRITNASHPASEGPLDSSTCLAVGGTLLTPAKPVEETASVSRPGPELPGVSLVGVEQPSSFPGRGPTEDYPPPDAVAVTAAIEPEPGITGDPLPTPQTPEPDREQPPPGSPAPVAQNPASLPLPDPTPDPVPIPSSSRDAIAAPGAISFPFPEDDPQGAAFVSPSPEPLGAAIFPPLPPIEPGSEAGHVALAHRAPC
nr:solute carrier family 22 member 6-B-like [Chrysemys picta bellii]